MPLARRILFYLVLPVLLLVVVGAAGLTSVRWLGKAADDILSNNYHTIQQARRMEQLLLDVEHHEGALASSKAGVIVSEFDRTLADCARSVTEPREKVVLRAIRLGWTDLRGGLARSGNVTERGARLSGRGATLRVKLTELVAINEQAMFAYERRTARHARALMYLMGASLLLAIVALVVFAVVAARRISRPVVEVADRLHQALQETSGGPGTVSKRGDEIARLRTELEDLLERLARYEDAHSRRLLEIQQRLSFVIDRIDDGLMLVDRDLQVLAVNRVGRRLIGMGEQQGAVCLLDLPMPDAVARALRPLIRGTSRPDNGRPDMQVTIQDATRAYRVRTIPFEGETEQSSGFLVIFWDVTEQRRFQEAREQFIATLSHQLKTPITSLSMAVNLLWEKQRKNNGESDELLQMARSDCAAVSTIVSELIEMSRNLGASLRVSPRRVDMVDLVRRTVRALQPDAEASGIEIADELGDTPLELDLDPIKFPWVVDNIMANALRYTPRAGVVRLSLLHCEDQVVLTISDTGPGVTSDELARMFHPFVSLDREVSPGSLGLGLAIARRVIEGHGGTVAADSEPGKGTRFHITVPVSGLSGESGDAS